MCQKRRKDPRLPGLGVAVLTATQLPHSHQCRLTGSRSGTFCTGLQASLRHHYGIKIPVTVSLAHSLMDKQGSVVRCTISVSPEQAKIGIVVADSRGRVIYANSALSTALHVPLGEQTQQHHCCLGPVPVTSALYHLANACSTSYERLQEAQRLHA